MEFRLLGPLEVVDDAGRVVPLGPPRQRALLAALCLHAGSPLTTDRLIDLLWAERPPATAATILHGSVAGLRKVLEPGRRRGARPRLLVLGPAGYTLDTDPDRIDAVAFERLLESGRRELPHDPERAERALSDALSLWRGRALAGIEDDFAVAASARLEDLRLDAVEARAEAGLVLGRYGDVAASLEEIVHSHPLRERMWALLMSALYRSGRGAEALQRYEELRAHLARELGADPSPPLRALHEAILRNDSTLPGLETIDRPTGVPTFLLIDIVGSSPLWERDAGRMDAAHQRFQQIVRECGRRHRGVLPLEQGEGDSGVLVFGRASDAVACAIDLQRSHGTEPWPEGAEIKVRTALHTGEAVVRDGTYYGVAINRCARLRELAHSGQVLLSNATADLVADVLPDGAELVDLGPHRLRDLARAERVWQLAHPGIERRFPPLRGAVARHNLPVPITSMVGRATERDDIRELLERHRLVTLAGPGGSGKTRLAVEVAREMSGRLGGAVWLVELASLLTPGLVVESVANVVGVRSEGGRLLIETVSAALSDEESLLVLDNCEHVVDVCATLAQAILTGGERARVLATGREALGVPGEIVYPVGPLAVAEPDEAWDRVASSESVRLFAERAAATRPGFIVDESNAHLVSEVCRRLDGMPLALELAAARVATTPLGRIAERLDDRFRLLDAVTRSTSPRHRSLEAAVQWSYDLLDDDERALFDRLSVFSGGFTLEAAEEVADLGSADVAGLLSRLVSRSLVQIADDRYRLLETLREYGRARLAESGVRGSVRERHARYYLKVAEDGRPFLYTAGSAAWYARLEADEPNFRAALEWAFEPDGVVDVGIRLICAVWFYWDIRGADGESAHWVGAGLGAGAAAPSAQRAILLAAAAMVHMRTGDYNAGERLAEEAAELVRALDDQTSNDALEAAAVAAWPRGIAPFARGDLDRARRVFEDAAEACLASGRTWHAVQHEFLLARVLRDAGDLDGAEVMARRALAHAREVGEDQVLGLCCELSASLARRRRDLEGARALVADALAHYRAVGYGEGEASAQTEAGRLALDAGDVDAAGTAFAQALDLCRRMGHRAGASAAIEGLARLLGSAGDAEGAALLIGGASGLRAQIGAPLPAAEKASQDEELKELGDRLGRTALEEALARGAAMSLDDLAEVSAGRRLARV